jgi:hypothetical protein
MIHGRNVLLLTATAAETQQVKASPATVLQTDSKKSSL